MLLSLVLFGSRARGDSRITSDVDLLGVVEGTKIHEEAAVNGASFYQYPLSVLKTMSASGDLFMLHLVKESKILHDTADVFKNICNDFRYKNSYGEDILSASALMWYIISFSKFEDSKILRRRLIWCIRTILIARSAERRTPVFSSRDLEEFSSIKNLKRIIDKRDNIEGHALINMCQHVHENFGENIDSLWGEGQHGKFYNFLFERGGIFRSTLKQIAAGNQSIISLNSFVDEYS